MSRHALREPRQRAPHGWSGTILDTAADAGDRVRVRLTAFAESGSYFGPMPFMPRGDVLPTEGDPCVVLGDEDRAYYVVWWEPAP